MDHNRLHRDNLNGKIKQRLLIQEDEDYVPMDQSSPSIANTVSNSDANSINDEISLRQNRLNSILKSLFPVIFLCLLNL